MTQMQHVSLIVDRSRYSHDTNIHLSDYTLLDKILAILFCIIICIWMENFFSFLTILRII